MRCRVKSLLEETLASLLRRAVQGAEHEVVRCLPHFFVWGFNCLDHCVFGVEGVRVGVASRGHGLAVSEKSGGSRVLQRFVVREVLLEQMLLSQGGWVQTCLSSSIECVLCFILPVFQGWKRYVGVC